LWPAATDDDAAADAEAEEEDDDDEAEEKDDAEMLGSESLGRRAVVAGGDVGEGSMYMPGVKVLNLLLGRTPIAFSSSLSRNDSLNLSASLLRLVLPRCATEDAATGLARAIDTLPAAPPLLLLLLLLPPLLLPPLLLPPLILPLVPLPLLPT